MKKFLMASAIACMLSCTALAVNAECNCCPQAQRGEISVSASAEKEVAPDTAQISIQVTTYDSKSMQKASTENKEISDKVYTALKAMINPANSDYIKTANYNATALYNYNNNKKIFDKYQVSNSIIVRTKNIDKLGSMIDKATNLGATEINDLSFSVSNYDSQSEELIAQAARKAKNTANILAKNTTATILGIKSVSSNCSSSDNEPKVYFRSYKMMAMANGAQDTSVQESQSPISAGNVKLRATVNATFYAK